MRMHDTPAVPAEKGDARPVGKRNVKPDLETTKHWKRRPRGFAPKPEGYVSKVPQAEPRAKDFWHQEMGGAVGEVGVDLRPPVKPKKRTQLKKRERALAAGLPDPYADAFIEMPPEAPVPMTPELWTHLLEWVSQGKPVFEWCRYRNHPTWRQFNAHLRKAPPEARAQFNQAKALGHEHIAEQVLVIADEEPQYDPFGRVDNGWVQYQRHRTWCRMQMLSIWDPKKYSPGRRVEHSGGVQLVVSTGVPTSPLAATATVELEGAALGALGPGQPARALPSSTGTALEVEADTVDAEYEPA
jgi:hypothetical protein